VAKLEDPDTNSSLASVEKAMGALDIRLEFVPEADART
jgi:hypothetical protein